MPLDTKQPDVSVIIPVYNRRDVVRRAVTSLLEQDFRRPYEVLVVDDGSTDGTAEVLADFGRCVRVIRQKNGGAASARRTGMLEARASIVAFLDSDDIAEPFHLSRLWTGLHKSTEIVLSWARVADLNGRPFEIERQPLTIDEEGVLRDPLCSALETGCFTASMNLMTYRDLAIRATAGRDHVRAANDYDFTLRLATHGPFGFVDDYTIHCDRRDDGISRTSRALQAGFAVRAAADAVRYSERRDQQVQEMLQYRVGLVWPSAFAQLIKTGHFRLALRVASIGVRTTGLLRNLRPLWWAFNSVRKRAPKTCQT